MKNKRYDFTEIRQAIKEARKKKGLTREAVAEKLGITSRSLAAIENDGQPPRFQTFYILVTMMDVSIDEFLYPESMETVSSQRRQINQLLDDLADNELTIIESTINGIFKARELNNK